jgi:hypothetical protein
MRLPPPEIPAGLPARSCGGFDFLWRRRFYARSSGLRKSNSDHLLRRLSPVLALANMVHLFTDKFARLGARRLSFASIFLGTFYSLFLRRRSLTLGLA